MELVDEGTGATGRGSEEGRVHLPVSEATLRDTGRVQGGAERDRAAPTPLRPQGSRAGAGAGGGGSAGGLGWGPVATWAPAGGVPPDGGDPALPRGLGRPARRPGRVVTPVEARGSTVQAFAGPRRRPLCPCGPERARRHRSVNRTRFSREASSSCFSPSLKNTNCSPRPGRAGPGRGCRPPRLASACCTGVCGRSPASDLLAPARAPWTPAWSSRCHLHEGALMRRKQESRAQETVRGESRSRLSRSLARCRAGAGRCSGGSRGPWRGP